MEKVKYAGGCIADDYRSGSQKRREVPVQESALPQPGNLNRMASGDLSRMSSKSSVAPSKTSKVPLRSSFAEPGPSFATSCPSHVTATCAPSPSSSRYTSPYGTGVAFVGNQYYPSFMPDPAAMSRMKLYDSYGRLQHPALPPPENLLQVQPVYAYTKNLQTGIAYHDDAVVGEFASSDLLPVLPVERQVVAGPSLIGSRLSDPNLSGPSLSVPKPVYYDDMMTGITMISGKPLSGKVMVGDARAITSQQVTASKISETRISSEILGERMIPVEDKIRAGMYQSLNKLQKSVSQPNDKHQPPKIRSVERSSFSRNLSSDKITSNKPTLSRKTSSQSCRDLIYEKIVKNSSNVSRNTLIKTSGMTAVIPVTDSAISAPSNRPRVAVSQVRNAAADDLSSEVEDLKREEPAEVHVIHWFRRGLRLHDNPSLREALRNCTTFRCIYILDPWFAGSSNVGVNKWR